MLQISNESDKNDDNYDRAYSSFTIEVIDCARYKCDSFIIKIYVVSEYYTLLMVLKVALSTVGAENIKRGDLLFLPKISNVAIETEEKNEFTQIGFKASSGLITLPRTPCLLSVNGDAFNNI